MRSIYDKYEDNLYVMRIRARDGDPEARADMALYEKNGKLINKLRDEKSRLQRLESDLTRNNNREISTWDTSGPQSEKPRLGDRYFATGFERLRNTLYHEMGHHIHENIRLRTISSFNDGGGRFEPSAGQVTHPLENYLTKNRLKFLNSEGKARQYSTYAHITNMSGLQKILQITGWAKRQGGPCVYRANRKTTNRQRFCGFIMSKAFKQAQKILEDKGREISQEDVEVF